MKTYSISHDSSPAVSVQPDLRVTNVTYVNTVNHSDWHFPLHVHKNTLELSLVLKGNGILYMGNNIYHTKPGDLIIKNANTPHSEKKSPDSSIEQIYLNLSGIHNPNFPSNCLLPKQACPVIKTGTFFSFYKETFLYALLLCEEKSPNHSVILNSLASTILASLSVILPKAEEFPTDKTISPIIQEIISHLDTYYYKNISLDDLSKQFYFSTYYLARKFKEETGYTINQYVIHRRIGEAQRMLIFENKSIQEISQINGFSSLQHFYSTFKKHSGCTPIEFRNLYHE